MYQAELLAETALREYRQKVPRVHRTCQEAIERMQGLIIPATGRPVRVERASDISLRIGAYGSMYCRYILLSTSPLKSLLDRAQRGADCLRFSLTHRAFIVQAHRMEDMLNKLCPYKYRWCVRSTNQSRADAVVKRMVELRRRVSSVYDLCLFRSRGVVRRIVGCLYRSG